MSRNDGSDAFWVVDQAGNKLVGEAIPSDVHRGRWRAAVADPRQGYSFVCVTERGETLVDYSQVGTETFSSPQDAMAAVARHRIV
ncbi:MULTISPECIES: hypothetical protein [Actinoalloteichus]|uniref:hypothetical protein n=1 Tax=Actinoalloteichus TaxID=65496 RepID=UPI0012FC5C64|nr:MULTISPECIES: hypothetical protein [Actinoalloteichus]